MNNLLLTVIALKSQIHRHKLFEIILLTFLGVLMYVSQVILAWLPNIEIVTVLIIVTTCLFGVKALCSVYIFAICEIATYGLGLWSINYLYVWTVLVLIVILIKKVESKEIFALTAGIYGLCFGTLCSIPYFFMGVTAGIANIISGFWFDILHCVGNLITVYFLYEPFKKALDWAKSRYK